MASSRLPPQIILGTHTIGDVTQLPGIIHIDKVEEVQALLDLFHGRGYRAIDTARNYVGSEERLGKAGVAPRFTVHTKVLDGTPGSHEPAKIELSISRSLADLQTSTTESMFLHVPDRQTPFEDAAAAMNKAFHQGKFKRFGLSNYTAEEVQKFLDICEEKGYVKPSIYQGNYNAIMRGGEKELIPLLRKHNMAFFAYSPGAGGLFSGNAGKSTVSTRWSEDNVVGKRALGFYTRPSTDDAVAAVRRAAEKHGVTGHAAALRWTTFHSMLDGKHGDAVVFGVRTMEQLEQSLDAFEDGPLPDELADAITAVYKSFEGGEEPTFHM
ncbi:NADP-dependent oxidoreductase domain-containing protein [Chaetomium sp. MPI-CAGE-AT-0009]|nr:NADP-dependent oxidoreductase domain-containing protein [Chaetomium sp. MPI-CAGE-AT-0009]